MASALFSLLAYPRFNACSQACRAIAPLLFLLVFAAHAASAAPPQAVNFDAPAIVVAEPLDASVHNSPTTGGTFLRLKLTVSTMISPEYRGSVDEVVVSIDSPSRALRVI